MTAPPTNFAPPPDDATSDPEVHCPLCDYNLRGLTEPRCPECGHQSTWAELHDELKKHPWLFEHARKRKIRSFLKTFWKSQFPRSFWTAVKPTDEPKLGRLLVYWLVVSLIALMFLSTRNIVPTAIRYWQSYKLRQQMFAIYNARPNDPFIKNIVRQYGSIKAYIDSVSPYPPLLDALWNPTDYFWIPASQQRTFDAFFAGMLLWPWMTIISLQIFRKTLHRAKIKFVHIARCAIYSADVGAMALLPFVVLVQWWTLSDWRFARNMLSGGLIFDPFGLCITLAGLLLLAYRLCVAHRKYLRIPQPIATCIAGQLIVVLTLLTLYVISL